MDPIVKTNAAPYGQEQIVRPLSSDETATAINSDFETFLTMLTTQLENQDPLNPQDSTEFATQLAQFSGVEQAVLTNDLLKDLLGSTNAAGLADMAGWVGMEARSDAPRRFAGAPLQIETPVIDFAEKAQLVVYDGTGAEVQRADIANTGEIIEWAGVAPGGQPLPEGDYTFEVQGFIGGTRIAAEKVENYALVDEVMLTDNGPVLRMADGAEILASQVTGVRDAEG